MGRLPESSTWYIYREHFANSPQSEEPVREERGRKWEEEEYGSLCTFCPFRSGISDETK